MSFPYSLHSRVHWNSWQIASPHSPQYSYSTSGSGSTLMSLIPHLLLNFVRLTCTTRRIALRERKLSLFSSFRILLLSRANIGRHGIIMPTLPVHQIHHPVLFFLVLIVLAPCCAVRVRMVPRIPALTFTERGIHLPPSPLTHLARCRKHSLHPSYP